MKLNQQLESGSSRKLRDFSKKYDRPAPPDQSDTPTPAPRDDIFERMDLASKIEQDNSLDEVIDVFPDMRYILLFIIFNVMNLYKTVKTERPILTPASFVSYCLFQLYAFALINDAYGRPTVSFPASQFMNNDARNQLLDALCNSYVPPFMLTIFHALSDCTDPRRPGLQYFCTLAGSRFATDFGRYIPPQIFQIMHNISTEQDTSRNVTGSMHEFLRSVVFTTTQGPTVHVFNYIAANVGTNHNVYESWLYDAVKTLFSPVTGKSLLRRTNIQTLPTKKMAINAHPVQGSRSENANVYIHMLNADANNCRNSVKFIDAFSNIVKKDLSGSFQLGAVPDDLSGVNILVHAYSRLAAPTYHDSATSMASTDNFGSLIDHDDFATAIGFKQPTTFTSATTIPYPTTTDTAAAQLAGFTPALYLIQVGNRPSTVNTDKEMKFDSELDVAPRLVWLDPYTHGDGPISYAMLAGLIIESEELDGSSVPLPNPNVGLSKINRDFLQGSVPLKFIHRSWYFTTRRAVTPLPRSVLKGQLQKISHDLYAMEVNRLGTLTQQTEDAAAPASPYGFKIIPNIRSSITMFNKWAFTSAPSPAPTNITVQAWSPYRYVSSNQDEHPAETTTFMLINFRTLYGTHIPLVATRHASSVIPLS